MHFADWFHILFNINEYLPIWASEYTVGIYIIVFLIIFCETGLVVMPFLPGDSFLFLVGTLCGAHLMNLPLSVAIVVVAALLGDNLNSMIGRFFRGSISDTNRFFRKDYIRKTEIFFDKHGGKSLILARFVPIIRTYAPFVAGLVQMPFLKFLFFSTIGAIVWPLVFIPAGFFLGQFSFITDHIGQIVLLIVFVTIVLLIFGFIKQRRLDKAEKAARS